MKNPLKRSLLILLAMVMLGAAGGCAPKQQPEQAPAAEQRITLRYLGTAGQGAFPDGCDENNNEFVTFLEEKTGYDLEFKFPGTPEERNAILASGEGYDIMRLSSTAQVGQFYEQGLIAPLDEYLAGAPRILEVTPEATWGAGTIGGKRYAIPVLFSGPYWGMGVRTDWLNKLGLRPPETIDGFYDMLRAFTRDDPDGNGKNDTFGLTMYGNDVGWVNSYGVGGFGSNFIWSLFDLPNEYILKDGEVIYSPVTENAKQMLLFLNKLWNEGILDKEFAINDPSKLSEKIVGSKAGALDITYWHKQAWSEKLRESTGEKVFEVIAPPKTYEGKQLYYRDVGPADSYRVIAKSSKHPKEAVQFLNKLLDPEITAVTMFGIEGKHWNKNGDQIELTEQYGDIAYLWYYRDGLYFSSDMMNQIVKAEYGDSFADNYPWTGGAETWNILSITPPMPERQSVLTAVRELTDKRFLQFIVGETPIEPGFDQYVAEWKAAGGEEYLNALRELYRANQTD